jgi:hypothetical protein
MARDGLGRLPLVKISRTPLPLAVAAAIAAVSALAPAIAQAANPVVSTGTAASITFSSATLFGSVNPEGTEAVAAFQYGPTKALGLTTPITPIGNGRKSVPFGSPITGLTPNTTYYYRIVSTGSGTVGGSIKSFTTAPIPLSVSLATTPNPVVYGSPFVVEGTLAGTGAGNHEVVLQANPFPYTAGFQNVGNPQVTNATGAFQFPFLGLLQTAQLRVVTLDKVPVVSALATEQVAVKVTLNVSSTRRAGFMRFSGHVSPAEPGALVGYERLKPRRGFVTVAGGALGVGGGSASSFNRVLKVKRGVYRVFVQTSGGAQLSNVSPTVSIR